MDLCVNFEYVLHKWELSLILVLNNQGEIQQRCLQEVGPRVRDSAILCGSLWLHLFGGPSVGADKQKRTQNQRGEFERTYDSHSANATSLGKTDPLFFLRKSFSSFLPWSSALFRTLIHLSCFLISLKTSCSLKT